MMYMEHANKFIAQWQRLVNYRDRVSDSPASTRQHHKGNIVIQICIYILE